jgi:Zn-dependent peptidase ImmA (M78 family)
VKLTADAALGDRAGTEARQRLGIPTDAPVDDILATLERESGLKIFVVPLGEDGIAGAYQSRHGQNWVIVNVDTAVERQRFTLAHEYGHHYLGHGDAYDTPAYTSDPRPKEVQANYFAGALLVSATALDRALERIGRPPIDFEVLAALATHFGISAKAMRIRLETLGRLKGAEIAEFDRRIDNKDHWGLGRALGLTPIADSLALAKREGGRAPAPMLARALVAAERDLVSQERLPDLLHITADAVAGQRQRELGSDE